MQKYERRKCQRFPIELDLTASKLYKQDHVEIDGINFYLEQENGEYLLYYDIFKFELDPSKKSGF